MESYIQEWLNLLFRWLHVTAGIAWIGASFYFNWLEGRLEKAPLNKQKQGIKGELWAVHGGGFYEVNKYHLAPQKLPETLHWFKWEGLCYLAERHQPFRHYLLLGSRELSASCRFPA